jgi:hypothetical protein
MEQARPRVADLEAAEDRARVEVLGREGDAWAVLAQGQALGASAFVRNAAPRLPISWASRACRSIVPIAARP